MRILTLGDSWTFGSESSDPARMSWPAQMARKYDVEVINLGHGGASNQRAVRIGIEELCRDPGYDWVILALCPAPRTEILKLGKWHQIWPHLGSTPLDKMYAEFWHPWNDLQNVIMLTLQFMCTVEFLGPRLLITGLSMFPDQYSEQLNWIMKYRNDNDFRSLGMPLDTLNIGIADLDRKLRSLKAMHLKILKHQPQYLFDVVKNFLLSNSVKQRYGSQIFASGGHPNDKGYEALSDYFADKIGLGR